MIKIFMILFLTIPSLFACEETTMAGQLYRQLVEHDKAIIECFIDDMNPTVIIDIKSTLNKGSLGIANISSSIFSNSSQLVLDRIDESAEYKLLKTNFICDSDKNKRERVLIGEIIVNRYNTIKLHRRGIFLTSNLVLNNFKTYEFSSKHCKLIAM